MQSEEDKMDLPPYLYVVLDKEEQKPMAVETTYRRARVLADMPQYDGAIVVRCIPENETLVRKFARFLGTAAAVTLLVVLFLGGAKVAVILYQSVVNA